MGLAVKNDMVTFEQHQIASGDQHGAIALDHNDDGLAGDVQFRDPQTVPGVLAPQNDLFQVDMGVILQRTCTQDQNIIVPQNHITAGDQLFPAPADHSDDHTSGQAQILDGGTYPGIPFLQLQLDKLDIVLLGIFAQTLKAGELVHEACGDNTGGDGYHTHTEECDENTDDLARYGDGINIAIAYGQQGGHRPPDAGEGVGEHLRLGRVFQAVHAQAGGYHQNQNDKDGRDQLLLFAVQHLGDDIEGAVIGVDLEQTEDAHHTEDAEHRRAGRKKDGQIIRQKGQQIHQTGQGKYIFPGSPKGR